MADEAAPGGAEASARDRRASSLRRVVRVARPVFWVVRTVYVLFLILWD